MALALSQLQESSGGSQGSFGEAELSRGSVKQP